MPLQLVSDEVFQRFLQRSMHIVENRTADSYHCKTPDCVGWCIYEDHVNTWTCPACRVKNCLTCQAAHTGLTCLQYQLELEVNAATDEHARRTRKVIEVGGL